MSPTPISLAPNPFDPAATATAVYASLDHALAAIPDGHTHALVLGGDIGADGGPSATVTFLQKAPAGWNIVIDGGYDQAAGFGAGFMLAKSW